MGAASQPHLPIAAQLAELRARADAAPEALDDRDVLVLALRRCCGAAAEPWAARLLEAFGSVPAVLGAGGERLRLIVPAAVARELVWLAELQTRLAAAPLRTGDLFSGRAALEAYLRQRLGAARLCETRALYLDAGARLIRDETFGQGSVDHAPVYVREVLRRALELGAAGLVVAHGRAGGAAVTAAIVGFARDLAAAAPRLGVSVHDHLVVSGDAVISLRERGLL